MVIGEEVEESGILKWRLYIACYFRADVVLIIREETVHL